MLKLNNSQNYEHLCNVTLTKEKFPIAFNEKVEELVEQGLGTREECERIVEDMEFELELYYHKGYGLFAVETDAVENGASIASPYNQDVYESWEESNIMENVKLPKHISYDLKGYRGFGIVEMPLELKHYDDGSVSAFYALDAAEYCPYYAIGNTEEEAKGKLFEQLKIDGYVR